MKKQVLTLLAAIVLAGSALIATGAAASTPAYAEAPLETTGNFQEYAFGKVVKVITAKGAQVYSDQALTKPITGKVLPKGSRPRSPFHRRCQLFVLPLRRQPVRQGQRCRRPGWIR